jgi:fructokinase
MADSKLVVSFGEMLIDFVPTVSGVSLAESPGFLKAPGGAPANVAIAVSRLGGRSAFIGKLGDDEFGRMLAKYRLEDIFFIPWECGTLKK